MCKLKYILLACNKLYTCLCQFCVAVVILWSPDKLTNFYAEESFLSDVHVCDLQYEHFPKHSAQTFRGWLWKSNMSETRDKWLHISLVFFSFFSRCIMKIINMQQTGISCMNRKNAGRISSLHYTLFGFKLFHESVVIS